ncbi:angiopoietin-related protein 7-like [Pocillopora verrucosa]|uniref:angiopoietin-related protein 7-like n=1 Tax=Pocillopora verrucosa TaxID=203993 RepID=UPI00333FB662
MRGIKQGTGSALVLLALFVNSQFIPSTSAAPIDCQKNTAVCLEEILKELTQLQFEVKILTENRTLVRSRNCAELYKSGRRISGVYTIDPDGSGAFNVYCDQTTANGGWTVIQKRMDGSVDFNRTWNEYKHGFGNLVGEFWLGLDKINRLTRNKTKNKLRVDLGVTTGKTVHPEYDWFGIGNETAKYQLYIGNITNATVSSDSLGPHRNLVFGTWDRDPVDCAERGGRGWWYGNGIKCTDLSNLNGIYPRCGRNTSAEIHWAELDQTSAKGSAPSSTEMKIRPVDF